MSKAMGISVKFYQIWSCHVTRAANFENFYFSLNSIFYFSGKVTKFRRNWLKNKNVTSKKQNSEWKSPLSPPPPPPSAYRVKTCLLKICRIWQNHMTQVWMVSYSTVCRTSSCCEQQVAIFLPVNSVPAFSFKNLSEELYNVCSVYLGRLHAILF